MKNVSSFNTKYHKYADFFSLKTFLLLWKYVYQVLLLTNLFDIFFAWIFKQKIFTTPYYPNAQTSSNITVNNNNNKNEKNLKRYNKSNKPKCLFKEGSCNFKFSFKISWPLAPIKLLPPKIQLPSPPKLKISDSPPSKYFSKKFNSPQVGGGCISW